MKFKTSIIGLALSAIALTGCSQTADPATTQTKATETPSASATPTATESATVTDNTVGLTGDKEAATFEEKADADLVANEMGVFAAKALAHPDLMSDAVTAPDIIKDLAVDGDARAYLEATLTNATQVTNDTFNNDLLRPHADNLGRFAAMVNPENMKVTSEVIEWEGKDALRAEFTAVVDVFAQQRASKGSPWVDVTYRGSRHYVVVLVENGVVAEKGDNAASVWLVTNWETSAIAFEQIEGE